MVIRIGSRVDNLISGRERTDVDELLSRPSVIDPKVVLEVIGDAVEAVGEKHDIPYSRTPKPAKKE